MRAPKKHCVHMRNDLATLIEEFPGQSALQITPYQLTPNTLENGPYHARQGNPILLDTQDIPKCQGLMKIIEQIHDEQAEPIPFRIWTTEGWSHHKCGTKDANVHIVKYKFSETGESCKLQEAGSAHIYVEDTEHLERAIRILNAYIHKRSLRALKQETPTHKSPAYSHDL